MVPNIGQAVEKLEPNGESFLARHDEGKVNSVANSKIRCRQITRMYRVGPVLWILVWSEAPLTGNAVFLVIADARESFFVEPSCRFGVFMAKVGSVGNQSTGVPEYGSTVPNLAR
jgi:hypothetical protein